MKPLFPLCPSVSSKNPARRKGLKARGLHERGFGSRTKKKRRLISPRLENKAISRLANAARSARFHPYLLPRIHRRRNLGKVDNGLAGHPLQEADEGCHNI